MNYTVYLYNGQIIKLDEADINAAEFTKALNDPQITFVSLGNAIVSKSAIHSIIPDNAIPEKTQSAD